MATAPARRHVSRSAAGAGARSSPRRRARNALSVTRIEEPDIATAAISGVTEPAIAIGTAIGVVDHREPEVLPHQPARAARRCRARRATGCSRSPRNTASACACVRSSGADRRQRDVGGGERRRVIEAVADHEHAAARGFQRFDAPRSCRPGLSPPCQSTIPSAAAIGATAAGAIAGQDANVEAARLRAPSPPQRHRAAASGAWRRRRCDRRARRRSATCQSRVGTAQPASAMPQKARLPSRASRAVDHGANALARLLDRAFDTASRSRASRATAAASGWRLDSASRAGQLEQVRIDARRHCRRAAPAA